MCTTSSKSFLGGPRERLSQQIDLKMIRFTKFQLSRNTSCSQNHTAPATSLPQDRFISGPELLQSPVQVNSRPQAHQDNFFTSSDKEKLTRQAHFLNKNKECASEIFLLRLYLTLATQQRACAVLCMTHARS